MKRILSLILCVLMLIAAVPMMAVSADEPAAKAFDDVKTFTDVKEGKWYYEGVMWCAEQGYMAGESDTLFAPSKEMTRSMLVTVLAAIAGVDTDADEYQQSPFVDVKAGKWYTGAVVWANKNNIANGISSDTFGYKNPVTREQLVVMVYRFMQLQGIDVSNVNENKYNACGDTDKVHTWAVEAMKWAVDNEIVSGTGSVKGASQISPRDTATRAQIAVIVKAMMGKNLGGEYPVGSLTLGGSDISEFVIVYGHTNSYRDEYTAEDIANYIRDHIAEATGVILDVCADAELPAVEGAKEILIGRTNREDAGLVTVDRDGVEGDALFYEMKDNYLIIASDERCAGTYLAAKRFLEDVLGVTDFGNGIISFVSIKNASLENGVRVDDSPYLDLFVNFQRGGWDPYVSPSEGKLTFVNAMHSIPVLACTGCDAGTLPTDYSHHVAHHAGNDPCLSDSENIKTIVKNVEYVIQNNSSEKSKLVWVSQADKEYFCKCDDCAKVYRTFGRCATYLHLLNYVANELGEKYPGYIFVGFASSFTTQPPNLPEKVTDEKYAEFVANYTEEIVPPQDITSPDNVAICITTGWACFAHAYNDPNCQNKAYGNVRFANYFRQWCELVPNIYVLDYICGQGYTHVPIPNIHTMYENFKFFCEQGATGYYPFGDLGRVGEFQEIRAYLCAEFNMNPDMSEAEFSDKLNSFLKAYYGDGWSYIREYIDLTSKLTRENEYHFVYSSGWEDVITEAQWAEHYDYLRSLWDSALKYAGSDEYIVNVKRSMTQIHYVEVQMAYHKYQATKSPDDQAVFRELNKAYADHLVEVGLSVPGSWSETRDPDSWGG